MADETPDWFDAVDVIRAKVQFTEKDNAVLLALPQSDLLTKINKFRTLAAKFEEGDDLGDAEVEALIEAEDGILTPTIESWSMEEIGAAYKCKFPLPRSLTNGADRAKLYKALPLSIIRRLMTAVALHLGNE